MDTDVSTMAVPLTVEKFVPLCSEIVHWLEPWSATSWPAVVNGLYVHSLVLFDGSGLARSALIWDSDNSALYILNRSMEASALKPLAEFPVAVQRQTPLWEARLRSLRVATK